MAHTYEELLAMPKKVDDGKMEYDAPLPGDKLEVKLMSPEDLSCKFTLGIFEGRRESSVSLSIEAGRKSSMHTRHRSDVLVRVDLDPCAKHTNPDGTTIAGPHVHIAREGYQCKFAYPLDSAEAIMVVGEDDEPMSVFERFREFCNIEDGLRINWRLGI